VGVLSVKCPHCDSEINSLILETRIDELIDSVESELRGVLGDYRPARKWFRLTKAEAIQLLGAGELGDSWELIKRVEKKLKDKNK
jgi:hypothetical protein